MMHLAVDLGTSFTKIYLAGSGIVLAEPSCLVLAAGTGRVLAVGSEAQSLLAGSRELLTVVRPVLEGEIADEELDNVAGGGCHNKDGRLVVTVWYSCNDFTCKKCGRKNTGDHFHIIDGYRTNYMQQCQFCKYMSYESGLWLCNKPN